MSEAAFARVLAIVEYADCFQQCSLYQGGAFPCQKTVREPVSNSFLGYLDSFVAKEKEEEDEPDEERSVAEDMSWLPRLSWQYKHPIRRYDHYCLIAIALFWA
ncbi:unnamed protein product [Durusdinium trenchii]|uniref:Uncharacterized protein n=1 Tax=Durusdinium trenchii TaxID=1381693 RepID=A0ABP0STW7_9DINO|eukprot:g28131.t1